VKRYSVESDQYKKRKNISIFDLKQKDSENCGELVTKFKLSKKLSPGDITFPERLGSANSPRPIKVHSVTADVKMEVLNRRTILKLSGVSFAEDLCEEVYKTTMMMICAHAWQ